MDDKDKIGYSAITATIKSEENNSQLDTAVIIKIEYPKVSDNNENTESDMAPELEPTSFEETIKVVKTEMVDESEKVELITQKNSEEIEKVKQETLVEQPYTPVSDKLITLSDKLIESAVPGHESVIVGNRQQFVAVSKSALNNDVVKIENSRVDLDQQSVLDIKDTELKDLVMRELFEEQNKIKNLENTLSKADKEINSENYIADALSTLATAALNQALPTNGNMDNIVVKPTQPIAQIKQNEPVWCDVGVIKGTTCLVKQFYSTSITDTHENTSLSHLPDYTNRVKIDIQPGTAYKIRIAAINACGRGEWSEISAFKTCLPGYPGAPSAIKITKAPNGASLTWEAPPVSSDRILEYSVCLAIKNPTEGLPQSSKSTTTNLNFARVYSGPHNTAVVSHETLDAALIDRTSKPAIIFRIAAKNEKGYGPATQVRWLQDTSFKRDRNINLLTGVPKKPNI